MNWTEADLRTVTLVTIVNWLWMAPLCWLVLGLWLEIVNFIPILIVTGIVSWIWAIYRQAHIIEARDQ